MWITLLAVLGIAAFIESFTFSHVGRFLPLYLENLGTPTSDLPRWIGILNGSTWIFGLPLVPFWGVWADRYGKKLVIVRSAFVEAAVFLLLGIAQSPLGAGAGLLLIGFQLGNTGVMLGAIRAAVPTAHLGLAMSIFGLGSSLGFALGPALGGLVVGNGNVDLHGLYFIDCALSLGAGLMLMAFMREPARPPAPAGRAYDLALDALRRVFTIRVTLLLFLVTGLAQLGQQVASPFLPLLVQNMSGAEGAAVATDIGVVFGASALVGALLSPFGGALGDRLGYRRVLIAACALTAGSLAAMTRAPDLVLLTLAAVGLGLGGATARTMVVAMLATVVPEDRRSATLNLVLVPSYVAGIAGGILGTIAVGGGVATALILGAAITLAAGFAATRLRLSSPA